MAFEIEIKARLDNPQPVQERLALLGAYRGSFEKIDAYWVQADTSHAGGLPPSGLRVRRETGADAEGQSRETVLITYKTKELQSGVEVNNEREFTVSDAAAFEELLRRLGLHPAIQKEKRGRAWQAPDGEGEPVLAELSLVRDLGWFIELEILAADDYSQTVAQSRRRLLSLLECLGVKPEQIETRPYTELLRNIRPAN
ncbi:MAG: class IV adenylate cyclase [Treponema sp.]|jgi:predicted adenylyl cyclase CyaB|nr:class IV adenylate cyclase [Treponema sp.]